MPDRDLMIGRMWILASILPLAFLLQCQREPQPERVTLFVASSLSEVTSRILEGVQRANPRLKIAWHVAGSGQLRRQIRAGAACDIFLSADELASEYLAAFEPKANLAWAGNRLVLAGKSSSPATELQTYLARRTIALANPAMAPVGRYAQQALRRADCWADVAPRLRWAESARQAAALAATGAVDAAIVYRTDAAMDARLRILWEFPATSHAPIVYRLIVLTDRPVVKRLARELTSPTSRAVLQQHGFGLPEIESTGGLDTTGTAPSLAEQPSEITLVYRSAKLTPFWISLKVAACATLLTFVCGLALSAWLCRRRDRWGLMVGAVSDLPLVLPPTIVGLFLLESLTPHGWLSPVWRRLGFPNLYFTWGAAVLASALMALPLMIRTTRAALESVPRRFEQAAHVLGASGWQTFWRIQVPLARRGILAGVILSFFRALGEFGATLMVAGNIPGKTQTLPLAIYSATFEGRAHDAVLWVILVAGLSLGGALLAHRLSQSEGESR